MALSAVIVDDEQLARDELAYLLKNADDVNVVAQGKNGLEAVSLIKDLERAVRVGIRRHERREQPHHVPVGAATNDDEAAAARSFEDQEGEIAVSRDKSPIPRRILCAGGHDRPYFVKPRSPTDSIKRINAETSSE